MSNVYNRLTDSKGYTGAHKERFDENGKGKGLAGRENLVANTGSTSSSSRDHSISNTAPKADAKKPVVSVPLGKEKFGTQAVKPINIFLFRNGDKHHSGEKILLKSTIKTMDQVYAEATKSVRLVTGAVRAIYEADMKTKINDISQFQEGHKYLCTAAEAPDLEKVPAGLRV